MKFLELEAGARVHFMGICGTAMASLAGLFKKKGFQVTGSDAHIYPPMSTQLSELKIDVMEGYKASNLDHRPDLVIVGNAILVDFPEAKALLKSKIPYISLPQALADYLIEDRHSIVISGTHGKTTTTSMMAYISNQCDMGAGFLVGGIPRNFSRSFLLPERNYFILEGDEYDTAFFDKTPKFIHYKPRSVILTSIEFDHADIYNSIDEIKEAFLKLIKLIPKDGIIVYNSDDEIVCELAQRALCKKVSYGIHSGDYRAQNEKILHGRNQFAISYKKERVADVALKQFGTHSTMNALACFALSQELSWNKVQTLQALANFQGVKRRQEIIGTPREITVVEDFAHHPTAVSLSIDAMKNLYKDQKLFAVFEPRSATSRTKIFQKEYISSFALADESLIAPAYSANSKDTGLNKSMENQFCSEELAKNLCDLGKKAQSFSRSEDIIDYLCDNAKASDVILIMTNGGFDNFCKKILKRLEDAT